MKNASITVRIDEQFKEQCDSLFQQMGMTTSSAINTFLHQAVMDNGMPFRPSVKMNALQMYAEGLPEAGSVNEEGIYVLPSDWNNAEDDS